MAEEQAKSGWWGTALSKLKSALHRTKSTLVDPLVEGGEGESAEEDESTGGDGTAPAEAAGKPEALEQQAGSGLNESQPVVRSAVEPVVRKPSPPPRPARAVDEAYLSEVEEKLIRADVGLATAETLVDHMRREALAKMWNSNDVEAFLKREFHAMLSVTASPSLNLADEQLAVILIVGVNGTGKTTSIGKLCWRLKQQGRKVLIAAGDTFRAAAETQLEIWAERAGVDIVRLPDGSDPGAVVYKAIEKARAESYDVLVIDTAGRLHNKANLMAELKKIRAVVDKNAAGCSVESLLVVDASVGQNGLQQARLFAESCPLTGVILSKLDGSAKGGIVFSIARDLNLPIKLVGLGEKIDDLRDFEPPVFVEALFSR